MAQVHDCFNHFFGKGEFMKGFMNFLKEYGIIGLAIAVIIGGKLNNFVTSLVNDLLMPVVFTPMLEAAKINDIKELNYHGVFYGKVIGSAIDFIVVAFVVYMFAKVVLKQEEVKKV
jgi:large conductance mechanosensitive channel